MDTPSKSNNTDTYYFEDYRLSLKTRELYLNDTPVKIENKVFDFLSYLIVHHDRLVLKEELQNELWNNRPISESVLSRCALKARRAINDDGRAQNKIRTVAGRGFRFVGKLNHATPDKNTEAFHSGLRLSAHLLNLTMSKRFALTAIAIPLAVMLGVAINSLLTYHESNVINPPPPGDSVENSATSADILLLPLIDDGPSAALKWSDKNFIENLRHHISTGQGPTSSTLKLDPQKDAAYDGSNMIQWVRENYKARNKYLLLAKLTKKGKLYCVDYQLHKLNTRETSGRLVGFNTDNLAKLLAQRLILRTNPATDISTYPWEPDAATEYHNIEFQSKLSQAIKLNNDGQPTEAVAMLIEAGELQTSPYDMLAYAQTSAHLGEYSESERTLNNLLHEPEVRGNHTLQFEALSRLGKINALRGDYVTARNYYNQARTLASDNSDAKKIRHMLIEVGRLEMLLDNYSIANNLLNTALNASLEVHDIGIRAHALAALAELNLSQGYVSTANNLIRQSLDIRQSRLDEKAIIEGLLIMGKVMKENGQFLEAHQLLLDSVNRAQAIGDHTSRLNAMLALARLHHDRGRLKDSMTLLKSARIINSTGANSKITLGIEILVKCIEAMDLEVDLQPLITHRDTLTNRGWRSLSSELSYQIGTLLIRRNRITEAEEQALIASTIGAQLANSDLLAKSLRLKGNIEHTKGNREAADQLYHKALVFANSVENKRVATDICIDLLYLALQGGEFVKAEALRNAILSKQNYYRSIAADAFYMYRKGDFRAALARYREVAMLTKESTELTANHLYTIYRNSANTEREQTVGFLDLLLAEI